MNFLFSWIFFFQRKNRSFPFSFAFWQNKFDFSSLQPFSKRMIATLERHRIIPFCTNKIWSTIVPLIFNYPLHAIKVCSVHCALIWLHSFSVTLFQSVTVCVWLLRLHFRQIIDRNDSLYKQYWNQSCTSLEAHPNSCNTIFLKVRAYVSYLWIVSSVFRSYSTQTHKHKHITINTVILNTNLTFSSLDFLGNIRPKS